MPGVEGRWVDAGDLRPGDVLLSRTGGQSTVESVEATHTPTTVYHLYVEDVHNYAVGDLEWLVHNAHRAGDAPKGGEYGKVRTGNQGGQVHHTPAAKVTPYEYRKAPSVWMETADHQKTASWGRSKPAHAYRSKQDALINSGKLREAIQMDIDDIRSRFGNKYDANIKQMLESFGFSE